MFYYRDDIIHAVEWILRKDWLVKKQIFGKNPAGPNPEYLNWVGLNFQRGCVGSFSSTCPQSS